jgi:hypothetical protein
MAGKTRVGNLSNPFKLNAPKLEKNSAGVLKKKDLDRFIAAGGNSDVARMLKQSGAVVTLNKSKRNKGTKNRRIGRVFLMSIQNTDQIINGNRNSYSF